MKLFFGVICFALLLLILIFLFPGFPRAFARAVPSLFPHFSILASFIHSFFLKAELNCSSTQLTRRTRVLDTFAGRLGRKKRQNDS